VTAPVAPPDDVAADIPPAARPVLERLVARLADPHAPTAVSDPARAWRVHVADSLSGLGFAELRAADRIADVGSGAGFPGLVLAAALPRAEVDLIESVARKCDWIRAAATDCGIANARAIAARAEEWAREEPPAGGRETYAAVTARAVGRLATLAELASPLLVAGGVLVAWKGRRDPVEEAEMAQAAEDVAMEPIEVHRVGPYVGSRNRHLHLMRKVGATPPRLPRRPGMAKKRPFGTE
jgi:16S rRNA (guanine527-N7)-methyltransferase